MNELHGPIYFLEDHAGFIRRTLALAIDFLILVLCSGIGTEIYSRLAPDTWFTDSSMAMIALAFLVSSLAYLIGFRMTDGGTPGYRLMRIRYASMLDIPPTLLTRTYRAVMAIFLLLFFSLDHIWILFDPCKQAWHDKVTGFYVVRKSAQSHGTQKIVQRVINFMMLSFVVWEPARERTD